MGVSSGAGLGATVAMSLGLNFWFYGLSGIGLLAFIGALGVTAVVYGISLRGGRMPVTVVLLSGIALGALSSSITSYLMVAVRDDLFDTQRILFWLMGSLASRRWEHVHMAWPQIALGALCIQWLARDLNILTQGEEHSVFGSRRRAEQALVAPGSLFCRCRCCFSKRDHWVCGAGRAARNTNGLGPTIVFSYRLVCWVGRSFS